MARTRPRGAPLRTATREGSFLNPIIIPDSRSPSPTPSAQLEQTPPSTTTQRPLERTSQRALRSSTQSSAANIANHKTHSGRVAKAAAKPKAVNISLTKECAICATTRPVVNTGGRGFRPLEGMCDHFKETCNHCITKMVQAKIENLDLNEAILACPFPECDCRLEYYDLEKLMKKAAHQSWDVALLKHCMRVNKTYMSCLNVKCDCSFSIEDCEIEKKKKPEASTVGKDITCPYCDYKMCLNCSSPAHGSRSCEDPDKHTELNLKAMEALGAKPCPDCGTQIQKNGGCNHMRCTSCFAHFCFGCLALYTSTMHHARGCTENTDILADLRNYFPARAGPLNDVANIQPWANPNPQLLNVPEGARGRQGEIENEWILRHRHNPGAEPMIPQNVPRLPPLLGHGLQPQDVNGLGIAPHMNAAPQPADPPAGIRRLPAMVPHRFNGTVTPAPNPGNGRTFITLEALRRAQEATNNNQQQAEDRPIFHGRNRVLPTRRPLHGTRGAIARALHLNATANGGNGRNENRTRNGNDNPNGNRGISDAEDTGGIFTRTRSHFQRARPRAPTPNGNRSGDPTARNENI